MEPSAQNPVLKSQFEIEFSISDRPFEMRRKVAEIMKQGFNKIQLFLDENCVEDDCHIYKLRIRTRDWVAVNVLQLGDVRLYFMDLNGNPRNYSFPADGKKSFGDLVGLFLESAPIEVSYM
jgi:hypothetical protein